MILARVLTGRYTKGSKGTTVAMLPDGIHSTVNNMDNPTIFVVYHDAAAYPEYEIELASRNIPLLM